MCLAPFPGQCIYHKCSIFTPPPSAQSHSQTSVYINLCWENKNHGARLPMHPTKPNQLKHNMLLGENLCVSPHVVGAITTTRPGCDRKVPQSYLQSGKITCTLHYLNRTAGYVNPPPWEQDTKFTFYFWLLSQLKWNEGDIVMS